MSEHAIRWALRQRPADAPSAILLATIAMLADDTGSAPLDFHALRAATTLERPEVLGALRNLEALGLIAESAQRLVLVGYQCERQAPAKATRKPRASTGEVTLKTWRERVKAAGEKFVPPGDPVFGYADEIGLGAEMLPVQLHHFIQTYTEDRDAKRYTDWRKAFRNSVRGNWFGLWFIETGGAKWSSKGLQALASYRASKRQTTTTTTETQAA
jgi:hypothetical protein